MEISYMNNTNSIVENALSMLSEKRLLHTEGVMETALELGEIYGENPDKIKIAATCHDLFRGKDPEILNALILKYGLPERYKDNANLAHGKIAAAFIKEEWEMNDSDIINAVSFHTTGRAGMSLLEKIIFIADAIEPGRKYPGVEAIREIVKEDLDEAVLMSLKGTVKHLLDSDMKIEDVDSDTLSAIMWIEGGESQF